MRSHLPIVLLISFSFLALAGVARAQVIGGFDASRGGIFSPAEGSQFELLRGDILATYPLAQFSGTNVLTLQYLLGLDLVIVGSAFSQSAGITPLDASEQAALSQYVDGGGAAIILTDNHTLPDVAAANVSLSTVFGVTTTGTLSGSQPASSASQHPIMTGPAGVVTNYNTEFPGWVDTDGGATTLATLDNAPSNAATCLLFDEGAIVAGSGPVLLFTDHVFPNTLVLNLLYLVVPPAVPLLTPVGLGALVLLLATTSPLARWPVPNAKRCRSVRRFHDKSPKSSKRSLS